MSSVTLIALDVGTRRIGLARGDTGTKLAFPTGTLTVDGLELERLKQIIAEIEPVCIVLGYPRNQSGEPTAQTELVMKFSERLKSIWDGDIAFQDESLTSVMAEQRLGTRGKTYDKGDIDSEAATIILQDYLELHYGH